MIFEHRSFASALLLLAVAAGVTAQAADEESGVAFRVVEPDLNLGKVVAGSVATGTFVFQNDSAKDVRILRAKPS